MSSDHRERFLDRINGRRTVPGVLFFPDITDWYASRRTPPGAPRPFGPGQFVPDDHPFNLRMAIRRRRALRARTEGDLITRIVS